MFSICDIFSIYHIFIYQQKKQKTRRKNTKNLKIEDIETHNKKSMEKKNNVVIISSECCDIFKIIENDEYESIPFYDYVYYYKETDELDITIWMKFSYNNDENERSVMYLREKIEKLKNVYIIFYTPSKIHGCNLAHVKSILKRCIKENFIHKIIFTSSKDNCLKLSSLISSYPDKRIDNTSIIFHNSFCTLM
jgi:hypothetical protein